MWKNLDSSPELCKRRNELWVRLEGFKGVIFSFWTKALVVSQPVNANLHDEIFQNFNLRFNLLLEWGTVDVRPSRPSDPL